MNTLRNTVFAATLAFSAAVAAAPAMAAEVTPDSVPQAPVGPGPSVDAASVGNIAGLMYYCYAHDIDDDTTVRSLGRSLATRSDVTSDPTYGQGGAGWLTVGPDQIVDLNKTTGPIRTATCAHAAQRGITLDDGSFLLP
ncbi:MAG: hypothetical protein ABF990_08850 [Acetobacter sp.]|uniref:hypothetical protein n=1 Tax=Acetobacter sp. TaxID=440 RepID=UPI0039E7FB1A